MFLHKRGIAIDLDLIGHGRRRWLDGLGVAVCDPNGRLVMPYGLLYNVGGLTSLENSLASY